MQPSVPDGFSQMSCLHLPPEKWSLLTFQREVSRRGQMKYILCFPYVQFHCNCTTCNFLSYIDSCFYFLWPLCKAVLYLMCVFLKKERWLHLCIVGAFVRFIWLDLSVCRHSFRPRFFLLCSWPWWPTGNTAFCLERWLNEYIYDNILLVFHISTRGQLEWEEECSVGVFRKICILLFFYSFPDCSLFVIWFLIYA